MKKELTIDLLREFVGGQIEVRNDSKNADGVVRGKIQKISLVNCVLRVRFFLEEIIGIPSKNIFINSYAHWNIDLSLYDFSNEKGKLLLYSSSEEEQVEMVSPR